MKDLKRILFTIVIVFSSAFIAVWIFNKYFNEPKIVSVGENVTTHFTSMPSAPQGEVPDLTYAAEKTVHSVVHVKVTSRQIPRGSGNPFFDFFGYDRPQSEPQVRTGFGSGVIISSDGYIVTNNHVIDGADNVTVILNDKREFEGKVIGTDETTDIALLKIKESGLQFVAFGNSDNLKLGEWVLAVGNPFNLTSTVTAGIVSAKGRNIGVNTAEMRIESFIQTDAAVNRGNSGGALVNLRGDLIGINTAIASQTGAYSGYSFAVPSSIVQKVVADLKEFGNVQRAMLGVSIGDITAALAKEKNIDKIEGVYIAGVQANSGAAEAGIKEGDVVLSVDDVKVNSVAQLQEQIGRHRPGYKANLLVKRDGKTQHFKVTLRNTEGNTEIIKADNGYLGAKFEPITDDDKSKFKINNGIKVISIERGKLRDAGLKQGDIITLVNNEKVKSLNDFQSIVNKSSGGIFIECIQSNGQKAYYAFGSEVN